MKCLPARSNLMRRRRLSALRLNLQSGDQWHQHRVSMQLVHFMRVQQSSSPGATLIAQDAGLNFDRSLGLIFGFKCAPQAYRRHPQASPKSSLIAANRPFRKLHKGDVQGPHTTALVPRGGLPHHAVRMASRRLRRMTMMGRISKPVTCFSSAWMRWSRVSSWRFHLRQGSSHISFSQVSCYLESSESRGRTYGWQRQFSTAWVTRAPGIQAAPPATILHPHATYQPTMATHHYHHLHPTRVVTKL